jgi:hypothetical protein
MLKLYEELFLLSINDASSLSESLRLRGEFVVHCGQI